MHTFSKEILKSYQVRKNKKQKATFIKMLQEYLEQLGYSCEVQRSKRGMSTNLVVGDIQKAEVICTAHYDTCANMVVPNFITPLNIPIYLLYSVFISLLIFVIAFFLASVLHSISNGFFERSSTFLIFLWGMLYLLIAGYPNKKNANDNTSGVITLVEIMERLPEECRHQIAFVFFDNEEKGLLGSTFFVTKNKDALKHQLIMNYDCVSDGDTLFFKYNKKMTEHSFYPTRLEQSFPKDEQKQFLYTAKGLYPSDQKSFDKYCCTVGICALKHSKWLGYYMDRIHTCKDVMFDEKNIDLLADAMVQFVQEGMK
ncbi:MAG: M28 family peptidase [Erysipelotrichaceae bacterium]|nr:M28 family peptidase [Erysipelotrichaceae bacterium]